MASDHNLTTASPSTTHTVTHSQPITSILNQADSECTIKIPIPYGAVATDLPSTIPENAGLFGSQTTEQDSSSTLAPGAEDPARARKGKCTPSTTHLAPSATWTTCPYVVKDGRVNPDVRTLQGVPAINDASQSILYNAIAYALNPNGSYSHNVATSIDAFFFSPSSRMNPNLNFGQVVRGPGHKGQQGTFTGILDFRGIVKIVNGIFIMRGTTAPDWTMERDQGMTTWMSHYKDWLQTSSLGIEAASRPKRNYSNHGSFFASQLAAAQMLVGDTKGAMTTLQKYFSNQFQDQIASSGEQPFEAVRTRPYHYRCFNLEAMITNAKLGDQLGLNLWTTKSKYGATVQDALDYTMKLDPKHEEVGDIFPHVSAVAAAYGDPDGKYGAFLQKTDPDYQSHPFWYYDQTIALPNSPAAQAVVGNGSSRRSISDQSKGKDTPIKFTCPVIFDNIPQGQTVEIADGIFVTCDQLKGFYLGTSD
ncbi:alginate lyase-domain-containing protein [Hygrophoropsis aurantiaca]|uniref:Alginate lyase-domain-containing protein n=1 Tax=Hygrophoropsis aurantiaca TaxID=72124 RepID=A0ACB8APX1_9AGAM|nr:alginate lyase-domain-containing protein [Hygrophoropsis aurantiaca]